MSKLPSLKSLEVLSVLFAHGFENEQTATLGNQTIEFGSLDRTVLAGKMTTLGISVDEDGSPIATDLFIRISQADTIVFSAPFASSSEELLTFAYTFADPGVYAIDVRTAKQTGTFTLTVQPQKSIPWVFIAVGLLVGGLLVYWLKPS